MLGGVSLKGEMFYKGVLDGKWGMGNLLIFVSIIGNQGNTHHWWFPIRLSLGKTSTVASLIDSLTRQWNADVIDGLFAQEEADNIKEFL